MKHGLAIFGPWIAAATILAVGCGGGDDDTTTAGQTTATGASQGKSVEIAMGEFYFKPSDATTAAGTVTITAPNEGNVAHELVLAKTDTNPADLPTTSDGEVDEAKLEAKGEDAGEIADVAPGDTKQGTFKLDPGKYVMFCNLPAHYAQGMYGTLTAD
jgi:uncharacterized cupredoxin-like copper-binding protein